jgi:hypothetical protein
MHTFKDPKTGAAIAVKVMPRAKKNEVAGMMEDGTIRIRLTAAPVDGAANRALIEFLSEALGIPKSRIEIMGGLSSERKIISLIGITPQQVDETMKRLAASSKSKSDHHEDDD